MLFGLPLIFPLVLSYSVDKYQVYSCDFVSLLSSSFFQVSVTYPEGGGGHDSFLSSSFLSYFSLSISLLCFCFISVSFRFSIL